MVAPPRMARSLREALIEQVQKRPVLYDTRREDHRDTEQRDRAWLDIADHLHINSEVLKREWKILRDSLRQAMRKVPAGAGTGAVASGARGRARRGAAGKRWYFESKMAFLLPHMTKRMVFSTKADSADEGGQRADAGGGVVVEQGGGGGGGAADDGLELFFASVCACARALPRARQATLKRRVLDALLLAERGD